MFGSHLALAHIELTVAHGERVLLTGPNGAGKSTLLRLIATAISPSKGDGRVLGFDLSRERIEIRARTELVGHRTRLYEDLTPVEYLRYVASLWLSGGPVEIHRALEAVGLERMGSDRIRHLSQGMRQRLALARAWLRRPQLLLLDEPYMALDDAARDTVDRLARAGDDLTVILATHDVERAMRLADRVIRLDRGRLTSAGGVEGPGGEDAK